MALTYAVVGDLNAVAHPRDHCEGGSLTEAEFMSHPARQWLQRWLAPQGPLIDITRELHPERECMYTCWNTLVDARPANYGTRLDYTLITPGLRPWVKAADIQPHIFGSDHCPVVLDLFDTIESSVHGPLSLVERLCHAADPPSLAASHYDEFCPRKQPRLDALFSAQRARQETREHAAAPAKRIQKASKPAPARARTRQAQLTLAPFLQQPAKPPEPIPTEVPVVAEPTPDISHTRPQRNEAVEQWASLFTPHPAPLCTGHQEPAKSYIVRKPGINQGRKFWLCARPVGPGYAETSRHASAADRPYRCHYFAWDSDVRRRRSSKGHLPTT